MQSEVKASIKGHKVLTGTVTGDKMDKTIVVKVMSLDKHPVYKKIIRKHNSFKAHDEKNSAKIGDTVRIIATRPLSKHKRWRLIEVVGK
ncbi:MAG: 30S ribosomal protein S17 [Candidatus Omnitrophica bacterium]|nr:30S ribosomal protein S17 [Candidatus Omnitrophota bacterium]